MVSSFEFRGYKNRIIIIFSVKIFTIFKKMLEPWNDKSILPPPINTSPCLIKFSIKELKSCCNNIIRVLSQQSPLHKESAIFSRFLYKFDKKFRNDIGYRSFKKVNTALRKYLSLTLEKDVQNFVDILPENNEMNPYLPTRHMLQYILVRLMTFSKLMYRIAVCSKQAAIFYLNRIKLGESHWMCLMPYALLCRIWSMVLVLLQHSCNWYNQLFPFLKHLPFKGLDFLPKGYELPKDLEEWIDLKNLSHTGRLEWAQKININVDNIMVEDDEGDLSKNILKYVNDINKKPENCEDDEPEIQIILPRYEIQLGNVLNKNHDEGVAISRESFKKMMSLPAAESTDNCLSDTKRGKGRANENISRDSLKRVMTLAPAETVENTLAVTKMRKDHAVENVTDRDSLIQFIESEEAFRNKSQDTSLTSHLSFMQWQALKISLLKLNSPLISISKLERKLKKIWQEKCVDYL